MPDTTMPTRETAKRADGRTHVVNDWSIQVATVNGSGSQSSNTILMRSIFRSGVPVSGKNLFPSNIAGLPTWFTIRANEDGWVARKAEIDFLVLMNEDTVEKDIEDAIPGAAVVYKEEFDEKELIPKRDDLIYYPVPFEELIEDVCDIRKLRRYVINMIYVGVVARLLGIELETVDEVTRRWFSDKPKAVPMNLEAIQAGADYVDEHVEKVDPYVLEERDQTEGKIIIDGNTAAALGAVYGGCTLLTWYPITPSSSLGEAMISFFDRCRKDPETGEATYAVVQAEDELAAIGMAMGGGWAGARAMTTTSGAGISLMAEFAGLAYYAEVPVVVNDVQRVGPSTGLPTRTSQGDILHVALLSHGDTQNVALLPASVEEAFEFQMKAFDLAERLQWPIFFVSDLDLGMNDWMAEPFDYPEDDIDRGKVLTPEKLEELKEEGVRWGRYKDVDGDGIPWRSLPGFPDPEGVYFTRGSGHDEYGEYTEDGDVYVENMDRLAKKYETARGLVPEPVLTEAEGETEIGVIAYGTSDPAIRESLHQLREEEGIIADYLRLRAIPFERESVGSFLADHDRVYVVEQNRDAQMAKLLQLDFPEHVRTIRNVLHYDGLPLDARFVTDDILEQEGR